MNDQTAGSDSAGPCKAVVPSQPEKREYSVWENITAFMNAVRNNPGTSTAITGVIAALGYGGMHWWNTNEVAVNVNERTLDRASWGEHTARDHCRELLKFDAKLSALFAERAEANNVENARQMHLSQAGCEADLNRQLDAEKQAGQTPFQTPAPAPASAPSPEPSP